MLRILRTTCFSLVVSLLPAAPAPAEGRFTLDGLTGWWASTARRVRPGKPAEESWATTQNVLVLGGRYLKMTGTLPGGEKGVPVIAYLGIDPETKLVSLVWIDGAAPAPDLYTGPLPESGPLELRGPTAGGPRKVRLDPGDGTKVTFRFEREVEEASLEVVLEKR